jgi:hypothetical protein
MINVTALVTVDKDNLDELIGQVPDYLMQDVDQGLREVLGVMTAALGAAGPCGPGHVRAVAVGREGLGGRALRP